jgi:imidazolonepropionase
MIHRRCDSHTHIVYAGNREQEFVGSDKWPQLRRNSQSGWWNLKFSKKLNEATEEQIYNQSKERLEEVMRLGTGAIEIKSYGLTIDGELKCFGS